MVGRTRRIGSASRTAAGRLRSGGFTLLETAMAMVIVTVGIVAIIEAQRSFARANNWSSHEATATYLANELRERMRILPRHDPLNGLTLETPGGGGSPVVSGWGREVGEDTVVDFDDIDDYDGVRFGEVPGTNVGAGGNVFGGPIDAFGRVIPEVDDQGQALTGAGGVAVPLRRWAQTITVTKVNPFNYAQDVAQNATQAANGAFPGRAVDKYPLRVTVTVWYLDADDVTARPVTDVSWIVPVEQ